MTEDQELWNDHKRAQEILRERTYLDKIIQQYQSLEQEVTDNIDMAYLAEEEGETELLNEAEKNLTRLAKEISRLEIESLLSGEADANDCYIEIHPGAGGTESQDWAYILFRMYMRWAEKKKYKVEIVDESAGEEAGIKSATIKVTGHNAYGWGKTESGIHRLVRISPFDSNARRHTSFASVWVTPVIDDKIEIEILDKDLRVDTFRASGAGGQHVNKTDSAVRFTHIPTGIVVSSQTSRSQHKNRADCLSMLKSKLYEFELKKREEKADAINSQKTDVGFGHQIRSYVLHPYQMVKDLRTGIETSDTTGVLDGNLDEFMSAALAQRVRGVTDKMKKAD